VSRARSLLRTVLLALAVAFGVGFAVGTWLRCAAERPDGYLGAAPRQERGRVDLVNFSGVCGKS
jgi:hypothetical protein